MAINLHKLSAVLILVVFSSFTIPKPLSGTYWGPYKKSKIQFYKNGSNFYGKLIWSEYTQKKDVKNPNSNLRDRKLIGIDIFSELNYKPSLKVWKGKFYDPTSGNTYNCDVWLTNQGKTMVVRGYSEHSFITQIETLKRFN